MEVKLNENIQIYWLRFYGSQQYKIYCLYLKQWHLQHFANNYMVLFDTCIFIVYKWYFIFCVKSKIKNRKLQTLKNISLIIFRLIFITHLIYIYYDNICQATINNNNNNNIYIYNVYVCKMSQALKLWMSIKTRDWNML